MDMLKVLAENQVSVAFILDSYLHFAVHRCLCGHHRVCCMEVTCIIITITLTTITTTIRNSNVSIVTIFST